MNEQPSLGGGDLKLLLAAAMVGFQICRCINFIGRLRPVVLSVVEEN